MNHRLLPLMLLAPLAACPVPERTDYSLSEGDPATELTAAITFVGVDFDLRDGSPPDATGSALPTITGVPVPLPMQPGEGGVLSFDYAVEVAEPVDLLLHFAGAESHIALHLDLTGQPTAGSLDVAFGVAVDACEALAEIEHRIPARESLQSLAGDVSEPFLQDVRLLCNAPGDDDDSADDDDSGDDDDSAAGPSLSVTGTWTAGPSTDTCTGAGTGSGAPADYVVDWTCDFVNSGLACAGTWAGLVLDGPPADLTLDCLGLTGTGAFTSGPPIAGQADFDNGTAQVTLSFLGAL